MSPRVTTKAKTPLSAGQEGEKQHRNPPLSRVPNPSTPRRLLEPVASPALSPTLLTSP